MQKFRFNWLTIRILLSNLKRRGLPCSDDLFWHPLPTTLLTQWIKIWEKIHFLRQSEGVTNGAKYFGILFKNNKLNSVSPIQGFFTLFIAYILAHYDYIYLEPHHADSLCGTRCKNKLPIISCICCWTVKNKIFLVQRKYKHIAQKTQDFFRICNLDCISWIQLVWYSWINFLNMYLVSIILQTYNSRLKME